jgi:DNA-binding beta-propeller fold protein YncE
MGGGASLTGAGAAGLTDGAANTLTIPTATNFPPTGGPAATYTPITVSSAASNAPIALFSGFRPDYTSSCDLCRSLDGKRIYVLNRNLSTNGVAFRLINLETNTVSTFYSTTGTGAAPALNQSVAFSQSQWNSPERLGLSPDGTTMYVSDSANNCLRAISPIDPTTYLPTNAATVITILDSTRFTGVKAFTVSKSGLIYAVDSAGRLIRYSPADNGVVTLQLSIMLVRGIAISPDENTLYFSDTTNNRLMYMPNVKAFNNAGLMNLCGTNQEVIGGDNAGLMTNNNGYTNAIKDGHPSLAQIYNGDLNALTVSNDGNYLYVCCTEASLVRVVALTQQNTLPMFSHLVPGVTFSA